MNNPYRSYCFWNANPPIAPKGFVVGADMTQEWMLPWWFDNYSTHNHIPIAFVDFGLSSEMKDWCRERGIYIRLPVPDIFVSDKERFDPSQADALEKEFGKRIWVCRNAWFKKPLACLQTPFIRSVWMDLDCEVLGSLDSVFSLPLLPKGLGILTEYDEDQEIGVNSGVILFDKGVPLLEEWALESMENNLSYAGDQDILYALIRSRKPPLTELPVIYNRSRIKGEDPSALVIHWHGNHGKTAVIHKIQKKLLASF